MKYDNYSANEVAAYVIAYLYKQQKHVNNLKLQALLYFVQAEFLVQFGYTAFTDEIIAVDWGVKIPRVYNRFKINAGWSIPGYNCKDELILTPREKEVLEDVIDTIYDYTFSELADLIRSHEPWQASYEEWCYNAIDVFQIKKFYTPNEDVDIGFKPKWLLLGAMLSIVIFLL